MTIKTSGTSTISRLFSNNVREVLTYKQKATIPESTTAAKSSHKIKMASSSRVVLHVLVTVILWAMTNCDFGYYGHGHSDEEFGLRVCPRWAKNTYCDVKRDLVWRLKRDGFLWGNKCWDNLQGKEDTICGAVLKGSLETCNGNGTLLAPDCERDCRALHSFLGGDCTEGNRPRDRCVCYYDKPRPWSAKGDKKSEH